MQSAWTALGRGARVLAVALAAAAPAAAHDFKLGPITIEHPWARPTQVKVGGIYLALTTTGPADRLVRITSPDAERVEMHETRVDQGTAMMRPVPFVAVKPGFRTEFKPGGLHVMLMGLKRPLREGDKVKLVLTFETAGSIEVEAAVEGLGGPDAHKH